MLALAKRIARRYFPDVVIRARPMPPGLLGVSTHGEAPIILYARGLESRLAAETLLHELAHLVFDRDSPKGRRPERYDWRESRADRFAEEWLATLEAS